MFEKFKKRSQRQEIVKNQITKEPEPEKIKNITKEPQINNKSELLPKTKESETEIITESKIEEKPEITYSKTISIEGTESEFMTIKDYSSFSQLKANKDRSP